MQQESIGAFGHMSLELIWSSFLTIPEVHDTRGGASSKVENIKI